MTIKELSTLSFHHIFLTIQNKAQNYQLHSILFPFFRLLKTMVSLNIFAPIVLQICKHPTPFGSDARKLMQNYELFQKCQ